MSMCKHVDKVNFSWNNSIVIGARKFSSEREIYVQMLKKARPRSDRLLIYPLHQQFP